MPNYYFDSSALVKYYHEEPGSPEVIRLIQTPDTRHYISRLTFTELHSAFGGKVRSGHIEAEQFELSCERLRRDVFERRFLVLAMNTAHYLEAERLLKTYTADKGLRTLDSLQLSVALLELQRDSRLDQFVCADDILTDVAASEGVTIFNPIKRGRGVAFTPLFSRSNTTNRFAPASQRNHIKAVQMSAFDYFDHMGSMPFNPCAFASSQ